MQPNIISTQQITDAVSFDTRAIEAIEAAFASLAGGSAVVMPPSCKSMSKPFMDKPALNQHMLQAHHTSS